MKHSNIIERIKKTYKLVKTTLKTHLPRLSKQERRMSQEIPKSAFEKPRLIAYKIIGERMGRVLPIFRDLDLNLQKSGAKINFEAYVSLTVFAALLISAVASAFTPCLLFFALNISLLPAILFGISSGLFSFALSIASFYIYPVYRADKHRRELEDELPFTTSYMAILTSAGVSPEKTFYSLSSPNMPLAVSAEAKDIVRNVNLFGLDIISALERTSKQTPSARFREMLEGLISTIHSGSNSTAYLNEKTRQYMKLKRISLKKFSDTLSILSEFYVALLLTGPLLLVIMLSVMAMLGGSNLGLLSPDLLLNLLTYLGLPLGAVAFLIILDAVSPKW